MSHGRVIEYNDAIWVNMEDYLNIMLSKLEALGMELDVYQDDYTEDEYKQNVRFIHGFTAAAHMLAVDLASLTTDENRGRFFLALSEQMNKIMEAK